jgi:DNA-binding GntR family transcriptional regulator
MNPNIFNVEYLKKIQESVNLSDFAHDAIREAIITGKFEPGTKLKQLDIARQLEVSQQTVREALKRLVTSGLVVQKPNRGFYTADIPFADQEEIYEIRAALEVLAAEKAVELLSDEDLAHMRELLPYTASVDGKIPSDTTREANREFHMILVRASQKKRLIHILEGLWDLTWTYFHRESEERRRNSAEEDLEEHTQILYALEIRDAEKLREALSYHVENTQHTVIAVRDSMDNERNEDGKSSLQ